MKVAMCVSEMVPFVKTGGLADVSGALPLFLEKEGLRVIVIVPYYKEVKDSYGGRLKKIKEDVSCVVIGRDIKVYFIDNESYFNRDGLYGNKNGDYKDNLDRFSYYCKRALSLLKELDFPADVVHCHDWQTALIPAYLKTIYAKDGFYKHTKTVFTIHNTGYQGLFEPEEFPKLGLDEGFFNITTFEFFGKINLLKGGIVFSDIITTVSPTYSKEIQTEKYGFGLEGVFRERSRRLFGVLNGLDYSIWGPENDKFIARNYSSYNLSGKLADKLDLQKICGLAQKENIPLFGMVSRMIEAKGFGILAGIMEDISGMALQLVILATGEPKYHKLFKKFAGKYPDRLSVHIKFDNVIAHKIYAGSDAFFMPSNYEPCGLGQMISLKYGTLPIAFKTGGLADTVTEDNGFIFERHTKDEFLKTIKQAVRVFENDKGKWRKLMKNAFACDFSWEKSAKEYVKIYHTD